MPNVVQGITLYQCKICKSTYTDLSEARKCESDHDIVYVPIERADLKRFSLFLVTGEKSLLSKRFIDTIMQYNGIKPE